MLDVVTVGVLVSIVLSGLLYGLFRYEERKGHRFLGRFRTYADVAVLRLFQLIHGLFHFIGTDLVKQLGRYIYHRVLRMTLAFTRRCEDALRNAIKTNKTLARVSDEEQETRSKLEEIAYHKATVALSEEEKRKHRDKMLQG